MRPMEHQQRGAEAVSCSVSVFPALRAPNTTGNTTAQPIRGTAVATHVDPNGDRRSNGERMRLYDELSYSLTEGDETELETVRAVETPAAQQWNRNAGRRLSSGTERGEDGDVNEQRGQQVDTLYANLPSYRFPCDGQDSLDTKGSETQPPEPGEAVRGRVRRTLPPSAAAYHGGPPSMFCSMPQEVHGYEGLSADASPASQLTPRSGVASNYCSRERGVLEECLHNTITFWWNVGIRWFIVALCIFVSLVLTSIAHPLSVLDVVGGGCYTYWGFKEDCDEIKYTCHTALLSCTDLRNSLTAGIVLNLLTVLFLLAALWCCILLLKRGMTYKMQQVLFIVLFLPFVLQWASWFVVVLIFWLRFCEDQSQPRSTAYGVAFGMNVTSWLITFIALIVMKVPVRS